MTQGRWWIGGLAVAVLLSGIAALSVSFFRGQNAEGAIDNDYELYVDCNPGGAVDASCSPAAGAVSVDVVLKNTTGSGIA
ncbi:MAG: hypothetical protein HY873_12445, partial [Chloroflexi bacterium]|nr:hypothetical protein [Chloroflexota bacterium]